MYSYYRSYYRAVTYSMLVNVTIYHRKKNYHCRKMDVTSFDLQNQAY